MRNRWVRLFFILIPTISFALPMTEQRAEGELQRKDYKDAIRAFETLIKEGEKEKRGEYYKNLAKAYYGDQEHVKAFQAFLKALEEVTPPETPHQMNEEEKKFYHDALLIYLDAKERDPDLLSQRIRDLYAGVLRLHPEYYDLGFFVAIAYANLLHFDQFFDLFYESYIRNPSHFLAYKTKGILHIKLFERVVTPEQKEEERKKILEAFDLAKKANPLDPSLYRMQIAFSPESVKEEVLKRNLNEITSSSIILPRSDLPFYFDLLLSFRELDLARGFLAKARQWYPYSRTLDAAEEMIEKMKVSRGNNGT